MISPALGRNAEDVEQRERPLGSGDGDLPKSSCASTALAVASTRRSAGKLGIGIAALVDANADIQEGKLDGDQVDAVKLIAPNHAIIFRNAAEPLLHNGWDASFPQGSSCGVCERHDSGFDSFTKTDCSTMQFVPYDDNTCIVISVLLASWLAPL